MVLRALLVCLLLLATAPRLNSLAGLAENPHPGSAAAKSSRATVLAFVSVSGVVWRDLDCDGVREPGEPPFPSVDVELHKEIRPGAWSRAAIDTTDSAGAFLFKNVQTGYAYKLRFRSQAGHHFAPTDIGGDSTDSDAYADGWTDPRVIEGATSGWDAGLCGDCCISGAKWHDLDGDGLRGVDEPGLQGWTIRLYRQGAALACATTGIDGVYAFGNLVAGAYTVIEEAQNGWRQTYPGGDGSHSVTLGNEDAGEIDFGNQQLGNLDVHKVVDWNGVAEEPVAFTICIQGPSFPTTPDCKTVGSTAGWTASWADLIPGAYTVTETGGG